MADNKFQDFLREITHYINEKAQNECIGCFNNRPHQNGEHSCGTNKNVIIIKSQLDSILNEMDEERRHFCHDEDNLSSSSPCSGVRSWGSKRAVPKPHYSFLAT